RPAPEDPLLPLFLFFLLPSPLQPNSKTRYVLLLFVGVTPKTCVVIRVISWHSWRSCESKEGGSRAGWLLELRGADESIFHFLLRRSSHGDGTWLNGSGPRFSRKTHCRVLLHRRGIPEGELYSGYAVKVHIPPSATIPISFRRRYSEPRRVITGFVPQGDEMLG
ncbi:hypothetical protein IGI04_027129, partial [Brassica rapa subsp. trilocularis]